MSDTPPPLPTKQKLVTIYLDSLAYQGKGIFTTRGWIMGTLEMTPTIIGRPI